MLEDCYKEKKNSAQQQINKKTICPAGPGMDAWKIFSSSSTLCICSKASCSQHAKPFHKGQR